MRILEFFTGDLATRTIVYPLDSKTALLVDPSAFSPRVRSALNEKNIENVVIALTHGHYDHVGGVADIVDAYPDAEIWIHKEDARYLGKRAVESHAENGGMRFVERYIASWVYRIPEATHFYDEGDTFYDFTVLHTPGHTRGSVCLWNREKDFLFSGDTLFYRSHGRTDFVGGNASDMLRSLRRLAELPDSCFVYPGHERNTTIGNEKNLGGIFSMLGII